MSLRVAPSAGLLRSLLVVAKPSLAPAATPSPFALHATLPRTWQSALFLPTITIPIPSLVSDIWESILRAVPKKKTSHMKKRHRQMAGKALKDVTALNKCSGCGRTKRAHVLCPHCVASMFQSQVRARNAQLIDCAGIKRWFGNDFTPHASSEAENLDKSEAQTKAGVKQTTKSPSKAEGGGQ